MNIKPEHFSSNQYDDIVWCPVSVGWEIFRTDTTEEGPGGDICGHCGELLDEVSKLRKINEEPQHVEEKE